MTDRTTLKVAAALALAASLSACAVSVDPVVVDTSAMFDPRLVGEWEAQSGSERAVVSRDGARGYTIDYTSDGKVGRFGARLGQLGGRVILDVWPDPPKSDLEQPATGLAIPGHLLMTLEIGSEEMRTSILDLDTVRSALRDGQLKLAHSDSQDQVVLQGTTDQLRAALGPYLARTGALADADVWRRARGPAPVDPALPVVAPCFEASAWREADQLFHRDPHWLGADGASSVDLGGGRTLWLFGDTWIDPTGKGTRQGARMVSNSVAIQRGADPATATMSFYWGRAADGSPEAFVPDRNGESLWLGNGVRVADRLVLFFSRTLRNTGTGLGFENVGWTAVMVDNPDAEPSAWRMRSLETPSNPLGILVGYAAVLQMGDDVYALGSQDPVKSHPIYAARWPTDRVRRGELLEPEWWAGDRLGWVANSSSAPRRPLFENGQSDLTVHRDPATGRFLGVHTQGFGAADVVMRAAPTLTGAWSTPRMIYRPPEYYRPNVMIYSAKAHPEIAGGDLVLTYATNTFEFGELLTDSAIYYPRFVKLTRCAAK